MLYIGKNIKAVRKHRKMTQVELANECGLSKSFVSMIEAEGRTFSLKTLFAIALCLRIDAKYLLDHIDNVKKYLDDEKVE
jgi:transcriptional regulator with XRE-family HTH domain